MKATAPHEKFLLGFTSQRSKTTKWRFDIDYEAGRNWILENRGELVSKRKEIDGNFIETYYVSFPEADVLITWGNYPDKKWSSVVDYTC